MTVVSLPFVTMWKTRLFLLCLPRAKLHGYKTFFSQLFPFALFCICFAIFPWFGFVFLNYSLSGMEIFQKMQFIKKQNKTKPFKSIKLVTLSFICLQHGFRPEDFEI